MTQPIAAIKTVIIPAAGKGIRMRPATQVTPKELLPIYDRLVIQFAIDEAIEAGAERIIVVVSPEKPAIREFLGDRALASASESGRMLRNGSTPQIVYVYQNEPMGLGHAILSCQGQTLQGQFGVILPDDIIMDGSCLSEMASLHEQGHMIAATKVPLQDTTKYGIFSLLGPASGTCIPASGIVEKPARGQAPSTIAAVGRYILQPMIFDILAHTPKGAGGEVQLTDAIAVATRILPLTAFRFSGTRYDCGNHDGLLAASNARKTVVEEGRRIAPLPIAGNRLRPTEEMPSMARIAGG